ncbi:IS3 family transposase [Knoellia aerolata]|uniref:IS3 family transposase n=1 Tax=Knoellia aerolata TaxID=442954 RepID=UPI00316ACC08
MARQVQDLLIEAVTVLVGPQWSVVRACQILGVPRSTFYHRRSREALTHRSWSRRDVRQPHALSPDEVDAVVQVLSDPDLVDRSVCQAYWAGFDAGRLSCSQSTFYRIARARDLVGDRRPCRARGSGPSRPKPVAAAGEVNQLWSWDISELRGPGRVRYHLFLAMDVYSRYPVGWRIENRASRGHAIEMFTDAFARRGLPQVLHSDNGAQMRSHELRDLLAGVVAASYSRPHVSNDNPFSEALFKTIKYDPAMPEHFDSIEHAREWMSDFLDRYSREHRHLGLHRHTPHDVFTGVAHHVRDTRQAHLDRLHTAYPSRYAKAPQAPQLPAPTGINLSKTG